MELELEPALGHQRAAGDRQHEQLDARVVAVHDVVQQDVAELLLRQRAQSYSRARRLPKPASENRYSAKEGSWRVEFTFKFSGKRKSWKGTANGSLDDGGTIEGEVEWNGRNWVFEAKLEAGLLRGSHTEIQGGGERYATGTFELNR